MPQMQLVPLTETSCCRDPSPPHTHVREARLQPEVEPEPDDYYDWTGVCGAGVGLEVSCDPDMAGVVQAGTGHSCQIPGAALPPVEMRLQKILLHDDRKTRLDVSVAVEWCTSAAAGDNGALNPFLVVGLRAAMG